MSQSIEGLSIIASKAPVVGTHVGSFTATSVKQTQQRYVIEALTYVRPKEIAAYQQHFLDRLLQGKTSIGCIVAPFGYGKTSAAIDTWNVCNENGFLAVLPFSCGSIAEMGKAIATGIEFKLGQNSRAAKQVDTAYEAYLVSSAKRLAEQDVANYQIDFDIALRSIEDKIELGYLNIDATGNHLLGFLEQITQIVLEAGYKGLLIIVDEFQQFLGNINKAVITNFRTLVWGLRTRGLLPLGLLITMDPDTERNLSERAGDILHRIKEDSLYLDFSDVYDREFARLLWSRYAENFQFKATDSKIVDRPTLDAIGQICERHDLSNGPRTVIDLFQRIAQLHIKRERSYTPIDLIDDFLSGDVRFDGDRSKIASLVTELTSYEYIKTSPKRLQTLKLIAAFPRGCSKDIANFYSLGQAFEELADALRGEVLTELPEGMALIDLQRVGKPQNKLNIILKKYWMQITEDEIVTDRAAVLFAKYIVSPLFQPFRNILSGWVPADASFRLTPSGSYVQTYEGTLFEEYPKRRVSIEICRKKDQISSTDNSSDVSFAFVLQSGDEVVIKPSFERHKKLFTIGLKIDQPFGLPMPRDVRWIEEYLSPVVMSPAVILSLIEYINVQSPKIDEMTENELQRINAYSKKLNDFLISVILGPELFAGVGIDVISRGEQTLRQVLFQIFKQSYPEYQTLITSPQWESLCTTYIDALGKSSPIQTRGLEPLIAEKSKIAALFGFNSHAGFESQIRQFRGLASLESWAGNQGQIRFERHHGEDLLLKVVAAHKSISQNLLEEEAKKFGYLPEETLFLLAFLTQRGYVEKSKSGHFRSAKTLSSDELNRIAKENEAEAIEINSIINSSELENLIAQRIIKVKKESELFAAQIRILQFQRAIQSFRVVVIKELQSMLTQYRSDLYHMNDILSNDVPISSTGLVIDAHINGAQRSIATKSKAILRQTPKLIADINKMLALLAKLDPSANTILPIERYKALDSEVKRRLKELQDAVSLINQHREWIELADRLLLIQEYLEILKPRLDIKSFTTQYNSITRKLTESLSVKGLAAYTELYSHYAPHVSKIYDEVSTAVRATEIKSEASEKNALEKGVQPETENKLLILLRRKTASLDDLVHRSSLDAETFIQGLLQLEKDGKLKITFLVKKPNSK